MPVNNINKAIRMIDASLKEGEEADKQLENAVYGALDALEKGKNGL